MLFQPIMICTGMVRYPVDDHFQTQIMGFLHQCFPIIQCAVFRIDSGIIAHSIITAECTFSIHFADGINGHEPQSLHTHFLQTIQMLAESSECAFRCILTNIHFVHIAL